MSRERKRPGLLRRLTLARYLLPEAIPGVAARLAWFVFLYPLLVLILTMVGFGAPSELLLVLLSQVSAPGWLTLLLAGGVMLLGYCWALTALGGGVVWVAEGRHARRSDDSDWGWGLGPMIRTAKEYLRDMDELGREVKDREKD